MRHLGPVGRRRWLAAAAVVLLRQMAVAMVTTAVQQTPTIDEPVYVGTAAVYLQQHSLRYNPEHPPLGKLIIGGRAGVRPPAPRPGASPATRRRSGGTCSTSRATIPWRLMLWARLPVIVLTLLFGLVVFAFARDLAGPVGGLVALALYAFSPDVIAHGSLATLDVPAAGFLLTSVWLLWRARLRPLLYLPLAGAGARRGRGHEDERAAGGSGAAAPGRPVGRGAPAHRGDRRRRAAARARRGGRGRVALVAVAVVWATLSRRRSAAALDCARGPCRSCTGCAAWSSTGCRSRSRTGTGCAIQFGFEDRDLGGLPASAGTTRARSGTTCRPRCW